MATQVGHIKPNGEPKTAESCIHMNDGGAMHPPTTAEEVQAIVSRYCRERRRQGLRPIVDTMVEELLCIPALIGTLADTDIFDPEAAQGCGTASGAHRRCEPRDCKSKLQMRTWRQLVAMISKQHDHQGKCDDIKSQDGRQEGAKGMLPRADARKRIKVRFGRGDKLCCTLMAMLNASCIPLLIGSFTDTSGTDPEAG